MKISKINKKIIRITLTLFIVFSFVACNNKKSVNSASKNATTVKESTSKMLETTTEKTETLNEVIESNETVETYKRSDRVSEDNGSDSVGYPKVDGSTANMPLMAQIRSDYLGEPLVVAQNNTSVTTTDYAWRNLINGNVDLLLVYEASSVTKDIIKDSNVKLIITPIGVDALVFIENEGNPVSNLSTVQLQKIYTGEYKNWNEVGGDDAIIQAFQRPLNSGSQTLFLNLLMKGRIPKEPLAHEEPAEMGALIDAIASYNNSKNALGYSVFYYAKKMYEVPGLKLISVDGVMPSDESIGSNKYPFLNKFYVVIREDADNATKKLYDYILSDKGKEALIKAGYIPVM